MVYYLVYSTENRNTSDLPAQDGAKPDMTMTSSTSGKMIFDR